MGNPIKKKLERSLAGNVKVNNMVLQIVKSWKEVCNVLDKKKK